MGQKKPVIYESRLSADYIVTGAYVSIMAIPILISGWYELKAELNLIYAAGNSNGIMTAKFLINTSVSMMERYWRNSNNNGAVNDTAANCLNWSEDLIYLSKNDVVYLQATGGPQMPSIFGTTYKSSIKARLL